MFWVWMVQRITTSPVGTPFQAISSFLPSTFLSLSINYAQSCDELVFFRALQSGDLDTVREALSPWTESLYASAHHTYACCQWTHRGQCGDSFFTLDVYVRILNFFLLCWLQLLAMLLYHSVNPDLLNQNKYVIGQEESLILFWNCMLFLFYFIFRWCS
jgi:hypothetical protein